MITLGFRQGSNSSSSSLSSNNSSSSPSDDIRKYIQLGCCTCGWNVTSTIRRVLAAPATQTAAAATEQLDLQTQAIQQQEAELQEQRQQPQAEMQDQRQLQPSRGQGRGLAGSRTSGPTVVHASKAVASLQPLSQLQLPHNSTAVQATTISTDASGRPAALKSSCAACFVATQQSCGRHAVDCSRSNVDTILCVQ